MAIKSSGQFTLACMSVQYILLSDTSKSRAEASLTPVRGMATSLLLVPKEMLLMLSLRKKTLVLTKQRFL